LLSWLRWLLLARSFPEASVAASITDGARSARARAAAPAVFSSLSLTPLTATVGDILVFLVMREEIEAVAGGRVTA